MGAELPSQSFSFSTQKMFPSSVKNGGEGQEAEAGDRRCLIARIAPTMP